MNCKTGRVGFLLAIAACFALLCISISNNNHHGNTPNGQQNTEGSSSHWFSYTGIVTEEESSSDARRHESENGISPVMQSLRLSPAATKSTASATPRVRRRLPEYNDPAIAGAIVFAILLCFLLCCCRGMLCDLLACVCLWEICCGDGAVGNFDLMPL
eukprot:jgi/Psemu1/300909/fgenesh1_kg.21_\